MFYLQVTLSELFYYLIIVISTQFCGLLLEIERCTISINAFNSNMEKKCFIYQSLKKHSFRYVLDFLIYIVGYLWFTRAQIVVFTFGITGAYSLRNNLYSFFPFSLEETSDFWGTGKRENIFMNPGFRAIFNPLSKY